MIVEAIIAHATTGRIRMQLSEKLSDWAIHDLSNVLLEMAATSSVRYSPLTRSMVIRHTSSSTEEFLNAIGQKCQISWINEPASHNLSQSNVEFRHALGRLDKRLMSLTAGECGLRGAGGIGFSLLGLLQVSRGQGLPAGLTLIMNALRIMRIEDEELNFQ